MLTRDVENTYNELLSAKTQQDRFIHITQYGSFLELNSSDDCQELGKSESLCSRRESRRADSCPIISAAEYTEFRNPPYCREKLDAPRADITAQKLGKIPEDDLERQEAKNPES